VTNRFPDLCKALENARAQFAAYRSDCVFFAATITRGLTEHASWPRELVAFEPVANLGVAGEAGSAPSERIEDAMHLEADGFWHIGLRLTLEEPKGRDSILLHFRLKKLETRYIVSLTGFEDFEVAAPTPEHLQPIYESILNALRRHYESGLRLFLENGGRGLKIPVSAQRLTEMARGAGGAA
jgi:hypothetical protein